MRTLLCTSMFSMPAMAAVVFLSCTQACVELSDACGALVPVGRKATNMQQMKRRQNCI
jgi:hypothetical protein